MKDYRDIDPTDFVQSRQKGIAFTFVCLVILGFLPIISNSRPQELDAITFTFFLSFWQLISSIPIVIIEIRNNNKGIFEPSISKIERNRVLKIMIGTGLIFSITTFLYVLSFEKAGTVTAAIAIQTYPLFAILIEAIILRKMKSRYEFGFTLLLMVGIYYLGTSGTWAFSGISIWFLLALSVPLLWSIAHVIIRMTLHNSPISPGQVTFIRVTVATFVILVILIFQDFQLIQHGFSNPAFQQSAILMGFLYYSELLIWFYAIRHVDVSVASSIATPTPVLTMILAILLLKEQIYSYQIIAMIIVLIGLYGIIYFGRANNSQDNKES